MARHMRSHGFTLIELMIVLVVMSILATIAIPSYQSSIRKSRRADAQAALTEMYIRQEKWRANSTSYTSTLSQVGAPSGTAKVLQHYTFSIDGDNSPVVIANATQTKFRVIATAKSGQVNDAQGITPCNVLTIDESGAREPAACW